jgi:hypothetical protein
LFPSHDRGVRKGVLAFWTDDNKDKYDELYDKWQEIKNVD